MAATAITVRMVSTESNHFYTTTKNPRSEKLELNKYDPTLRRHVLYKETKINKSKK